MKKSQLALLMGACFINSSPYAGVIRHDIDMQEYRDFAKNRGKYKPGKVNIPIHRLDGALDGYLETPMPDLAAISTRGDQTIVSPTFIIGSKHVGSGYEMTFGHNARFAPTYHRIQRYPGAADFDSARLSKAVVESVPLPYVSGDQLKANPGRYTMYSRAGAGMQYMKNPETGEMNYLAYAHRYKTGGMIKPEAVRADTMLRWSSYAPDSPRSSPLVVVPRGGDSGSPVLV